MNEKRTPIKARCFTCGAKLFEGRYVYSTFTKNHYCAPDIDACRRRAKRQAGR